MMVFAIMKIFDFKVNLLNLCLLNNFLHFIATVVASLMFIIAAVITTKAAITTITIIT